MEIISSLKVCQPEIIEQLDLGGLYDFTGRWRPREGRHRVVQAVHGPVGPRQGKLSSRVGPHESWWWLSLEELASTFKRSLRQGHKSDTWISQQSGQFLPVLKIWNSHWLAKQQEEGGLFLFTKNCSNFSSVFKRKCLLSIYLKIWKAYTISQCMKHYQL